MLFNRQLLAQHRDYAAQFSLDPLYLKIWEEGAELLTDSLDIISGMPTKILELGARSGIFTKKLQEYYPCAQLTICELSNKMLELNVGSNKLLLDEDSELYKLTGTFDLIASNINLHFINDPLKFLLEVKSLLGNGGVFIATSFAESCLHNFRKSLINIESSIGNKHYNRIIPFIRASDLSQILLNIGFKNTLFDYK
jgi:SAM-dependent methyltransferase